MVEELVATALTCKGVPPGAISLQANSQVTKRPKQSKQRVEQKCININLNFKQ